MSYPHPRLSFGLASLTALFACGGSSEPPAAPAPAESAPAVTAPAASAAEAVPPPAPTAPAEPPPPTPAVRYTGFATPESVAYDAARDRYLVSNINGKPADADNNGFISELSPDGKVTNLKWIEGGKNKVTLNAPKGLAVVNDVLYVADLDAVRTFDAKTGAPRGAVKLPGATFANDVVAGEGGKIYVTDSGLDAELKGNGSDAVWVIEKGKAKAFAKSTDLARPNGLVADGKTVLVTTFGAAEVFRLDDKGQKSEVTKLPKGSLDGIVKIADGLLVSSWEGQAVYRGKLGGTFEPVLSPLKAPADIAWDGKRSRLLVPRFLDDAVEAYDVK